MKTLDEELDSILNDHANVARVLTQVSDNQHERSKQQLRSLILRERIDELYHVKPIVHRMGSITYNPRLITLESIAERIGELKAELKKEEE